MNCFRLASILLLAAASPLTLRADLPPENSDAVFRRMQAERQRLAATFRAQGSQQSQQIKANVPGAKLVAPADVVRYQNDHPRLAAVPYGELLKALKAERLVVQQRTFEKQQIEIEKAKEELLQAVATPGQRMPGSLPGLDLKPALRRSTGGFKIRY